MHIHTSMQTHLIVKNHESYGKINCIENELEKSGTENQIVYIKR